MFNKNNSFKPNSINDFEFRSYQPLPPRKSPNHHYSEIIIITIVIILVVLGGGYGTKKLYDQREINEASQVVNQRRYRSRINYRESLANPKNKAIAQTDFMWRDVSGNLNHHHNQLDNYFVNGKANPAFKSINHWISNTSRNPKITDKSLTTQNVNSKQVRNHKLIVSYQIKTNYRTNRKQILKVYRWSNLFNHSGTKIINMKLNHKPIINQQRQIHQRQTKKQK